MSEPSKQPEATFTRGLSAPLGVLRPLIVFFATGAGAGFVPIAPGTAGSLVGLLLARFVCAPMWIRSPAAFLVFFGVIFVAACFVAGAAERIWSEHDSSRIVLDEVLGMVAAMAFNPPGWVWLAVGLLLFRLLDIIKPWPAIRFDRMHGGAGVMLDDLAAGIYANVMLQVLRRII